MTAPADPNAHLKQILNLQEASDLLGISTKTFQKVLHEGEMPGRKVGREWKFSRQALVDWVARGRSRDFLDASDRDAAAETADTPAAPGRPAMTKKGQSVRRVGFAEEED